MLTVEEKRAKRRAYERQWYLDHSQGVKRLPPRVIKPCDFCGNQMSLQPNQVKSRQHNFCCHSCYSQWWSQNKRGEQANRWKGGRRINAAGYVEIRLQPNDFFYSMMKVRQYVLEHRLVMAKHLKRCLLPWEVVHHKNGVKSDNRLENLHLLGNNGRHNTMLDKWCKRLQKENALLRQRIAELENLMEERAEKVEGGEF